MTQENSNIRKLSLNNLIWYVVGIVDYLNTAAIYIFYLTPAMKEILFRTLQYLFFPLYAVHTIIYAVLGLMNLLFDRDQDTGKVKTENVIRLIANTLSAMLVTTAVIGGLAFAGVMGVASTFLFAANIVVSAGFNFGGAGYHIFQYVKKGRMLENPDLSPQERDILNNERVSHRQKATGYLVVGATIALVALGGALAVLGGFLPLAGIGIAAALVGVAFCVYAIVRKVQDEKKKKEMVHSESNLQLDSEPAPAPDTTITVFKRLSSSVDGPYVGRVNKDAMFKDDQRDGRKEEREPLLQDSAIKFSTASDDFSADDLLHSPTMTHQ